MKKLISFSNYYRKPVALNFIGPVFMVMMIFPTLAAALGNVPLYGLYETNIDYQALKGQSHSYTDPFYGVELETTFTSPSGRQVSWWGFFDGDGQGGQTGNIWKIRFMPDELGTWNFTWQFSDGSLVGSGSFEAVSTGAKPGPLKHDANINQWLVTADESRHVFINSLQNLGPTRPVDFQGEIDEAKANGFDVVMLNGPSGKRSGWIDQNDYFPKLATWYSMENEQFKRIYDNNMYLYDWSGFYGGNGWLNLHNKSVAFQNKVIKYSLARIAPYYFYLYNIGFELQEFVDVPSWPVQRAQYVKSIDPWNHLITGHELNDRFAYGNEPIMDFSAMQLNPGLDYHSWALTVWNSPAQPHPHVDEGLWDYSGQGPSSETAFRKLVWDSLTGGMSFDLFLGSGGTAAGTRGLESSKHLNAFMKNGVKWWTMSPHDEVKTSGTAHVLANLGVEYIAYSSSGSSFSLNLPTGNYQWSWFDPATGTYNSWNSLNHSGGNVSFNKPDTSDWVLHIGGPSDSTPATTPQSLNATAQSEFQIDLTWQASNDPESGISNYNIYRDGANIGQSTTTSYSDTGLNEGITYSYEISAVNGAGLESGKSAPLSKATLSDTTPPTIDLVSASGNPTRVTVVFSEPVEQISAEEISNYHINNGITVLDSSLGLDLKTVTLTSSFHNEGITYTLTTNNVRDRASIPNVIALNTKVNYTFAAQLIISNLIVNSGLNYEIIQDGLYNGALVYIDRGYTYSGVPALVEGATYLKTANDDKASSGTAFLSFDVNQDVTVYVAHDDRIAAKPSWMTSFTDTGDDVVIAGQTHSLWKKDFLSDTVTLGGNEGGGNSMYTVIVVGQTDTTPPSAPTGVTLTVE